MGRQIYLTNEEIEWLNDKFSSLREMGLYWDGGDEERILDNIQSKIDDRFKE